MTKRTKEEIAETAYLSCRRDIIFHIDEYIAILKVPRNISAYQKQKIRAQLQILEQLRCSIRNYVSL